MGEMKTITVENYPAARLPDDLLKGLDPTGEVTLTIVQKSDRQESEVPKYIRYAGIAAYKNTSVEEAVARIRELRDEWD